MTAAELGQRFLEPGLYLKNPIDQISLGMALVLGTAGMPHILMRFFTVPTAKDARTSVLWAMGIIGGFYILTLFLGLGAAMNVGSATIAGIDAGGNMAAPLLAQYIGGGANSVMGNLFLAFVAAVAFATIVAVVAGLVLASASAMSHDIWVGVIKGEHATQEEEVRAARISSIIVGVVAIVIGILAKGQNVAHLVALAFAVAASSNLPAVLMTLYWKRCNTKGIVLGMVVGAFSAIGLVMVSPNMTYPIAVRATNQVIIDAAPAKIAAAEATLAAAVDDEARALAQKGVDAAKGILAGAEAKIASVAGSDTSIVGLKEPLISLSRSGTPASSRSRSVSCACCSVRSSAARSAPRTCGKSCTCARTPASMPKGRRRTDESASDPAIQGWDRRVEFEQPAPSPPDGAGFLFWGTGHGVRESPHTAVRRRAPRLRRRCCLLANWQPGAAAGTAALPEAARAGFPRAPCPVSCFTAPLEITQSPPHAPAHRHPQKPARPVADRTRRRAPA